MIKDIITLKHNNIVKKDNNNLKYVPKPYLDVANGMESQFAKLMLEQMQKSIGKNDNDTSSNYYTSLLTDERSKMLTENSKGLGIKQMILDQIYPQKMRNKINYDNYLRTQLRSIPAPEKDKI